MFEAVKQGSAHRGEIDYLTDAVRSYRVHSEVFEPLQALSLAPDVNDQVYYRKGNAAYSARIECHRTAPNLLDYGEPGTESQPEDDQGDARGRQQQPSQGLGPGSILQYGSGITAQHHRHDEIEAAENPSVLVTLVPGPAAVRIPGHPVAVAPQDRLVDGHGHVPLRVKIHIAEYDEWGDETEGRDTLITEEFRPEEVYSARIKESWYIDKQDTRQKVRILGLTLVYNYCKDRDGERVCDNVEMFWVPMDDMRVRNALVKIYAYDENNSHSVRTYDDIFIERYFDSFVYREANTYNRTIASYLTGTDAILESQAIENKIFDIESDMWEY